MTRTQLFLLSESSLFSSLRHGLRSSYQLLYTYYYISMALVKLRRFVCIWVWREMVGSYMYLIIIAIALNIVYMLHDVERTGEFQTTFVVCFFIFCFTNSRLERRLYAKLKNWMSNSVDPDETAHYEPSHLDLCCLQMPIFFACGSERVKGMMVPLIQKYFDIIQ